MSQPCFFLLYQTAKLFPQGLKPGAAAVSATYCGTNGPLVNHEGDPDEGRYGPPENETQIQDWLRQVQLNTDPSEAAPDQGCAENAEQPTGRGDEPEQKGAVGCLRGLLSARANAHLRASG